MPCRLQELRKKEVINANDGCRIGYVDDLEIDTKNARVVAIVIYGRMKWFWRIFGGCDDCRIPWDRIRLIGEDAILVDYSVQKMAKKAKNRHKFVTICHLLFL